VRVPVAAARAPRRGAIIRGCRQPAIASRRDGSSLVLQPLDIGIGGMHAVWKDGALDETKMAALAFEVAGSNVDEVVLGVGASFCWVVEHCSSW
jgi:hypothetical protein